MLKGEESRRPCQMILHTLHPVHGHERSLHTPTFSLPLGLFSSAAGYWHELTVLGSPANTLSWLGMCFLPTTV